MTKKIAVLTTNKNGGIIQFSLEMYKHLCDLNHEAYCFIPKSGIFNVSPAYSNRIRLFGTGPKKGKALYKVFKFFPRNEVARNIADEILSLSPDVLWLTDNALLTTQVGRLVSGRIPVMLTMHDAGGTHPTNDRSPLEKFRMYVRQRSSLALEKRSRSILVLSKYSRGKYIRLNPQNADKVVMMPLAAHIPDAAEKRPSEAISDNYFLFFGRIDKYKGLSTLLNAFNKLPHGKLPLVIAGSGSLTSEEKALCGSEGVILINRYIDDGEMIWLIKNATCVILPYIEATQSGIIPISYHYGVPVITSGVEGLTQFVDEGITGFVCNTVDDYAASMQKICEPEIRAGLSQGAKKYELDNLDPVKNIGNLISEI